VVQIINTDLYLITNSNIQGTVNLYFLISPQYTVGYRLRLKQSELRIHFEVVTPKQFVKCHIIDT